MTSIDAAAAARFLAALTSDTAHTFQTFDDAKQGRKGLTRILHGTLAACLETLAVRNQKGAGVFVVVNRTDGNGRKASNVIACRALFLDLDGAPIGPVLAAPIPPRIVVESSPGKWHAYWPIVDLPPERFTSAQKALAARFAGDAHVSDLSRVMRLPGFLHSKGAPFVSRLVQCESGPLTWHEMAQAFGLPRRMTLPSVLTKGQRNPELYELARSSAKKGIPELAQLDRLRTVNAERCQPPLPDWEVLGINARAYRAPQEGVAALPLAVMDSNAYRALSHALRTLLLLAYRRLDGFNNGRISLAWSECERFFPDEKTFYRQRKRLVASGLIQIAQPATKPSKGKQPTAGFYRLPIGVKNTPYAVDLIGVKNTPLEALQALAVEALDHDLDVGGQKRRNPTTKKAGREPC